jgi:mRNA interferase MazF
LGYLGKIRPVLVVGVPFLERERTLCIIIPHTKSLIGTRFEVEVNHSALQAKGAFDVQQIAAVPAIKFVRRLGVLNSQQMRQVEIVLAQALGLTLAMDHL